MYLEATVCDIEEADVTFIVCDDDVDGVVTNERCWIFATLLLFKKFELFVTTVGVGDDVDPADVITFVESVNKFWLKFEFIWFWIECNERVEPIGTGVVELVVVISVE